MLKMVYEPKEVFLPFMTLHLGERDKSIEYVIKFSSSNNTPTKQTDSKEEKVPFGELYTFIKLKYPSKIY